MKNKTLGIVLVLVVIVGAGWWYFNNGGSLGIPGTGDTSTQDPQSNTNGGGDGTATNPTAQAPKTYSSAAHGFSFEYPAPATLETSGLSAGGFKALNAQGVVAVYTRFNNVVDRFAVNVSEDPGDIGGCMKKPEKSSDTANINGVPFLKYQTEEQVEGQSVITTVYRIERDTKCYEIRNVVNSPILSQLTAEEVRQRTANVAAAAAFADSILKTFKFTR